MLREDGSGLLLAPKREVRQTLKVSPDGSAACVLCHASQMQKTRKAPLRVGGGGRGKAGEYVLERRLYGAS